MEITKFSSQCFAALEQVTVNVRRALNTLTVWRKAVPEKTRSLQEAYRASELQKVLASSLDTIAVTTHKITKFRPQLVAALQQVSAHVRQVLNGLAEWGKSVPEKTRRLQESYRASELQKVLARLPRCDCCDDSENYQIQAATRCRFATSGGACPAGTERAR